MQNFQTKTITLAIMTALTPSVFASDLSCPLYAECGLDGQTITTENTNRYSNTHIGYWGNTDQEIIRGKTLTFESTSSTMGSTNFYAAATVGQNVTLKNNHVDVNWSNIAPRRSQVYAAAASVRSLSNHIVENNSMTLTGGSTSKGNYQSQQHLVHAAWFESLRMVDSTVTNGANYRIQFRNNTLTIQGSEEGVAKEYMTAWEFSAAHFDTSHLDNYTEGTIRTVYDGNHLYTKDIILDGLISDGGAAVSLWTEGTFLHADAQLEVQANGNVFEAENTVFHGGLWAGVVNRVIDVQSMQLTNNKMIVKNSTFRHRRAWGESSSERKLAVLAGVGGHYSLLPTGSPTSDRLYSYSSRLTGNGVEIYDVKTNPEKTDLAWVVGALSHVPQRGYKTTLRDNYVYIENSTIYANPHHHDDRSHSYQQLVIAGAIVANLPRNQYSAEKVELTNNSVHVKNSYIDGYVFGATLSRGWETDKLFTPVNGTNRLILEGHNELCYVDGFHYMEFILGEEKTPDEPALVLHHHDDVRVGSFTLDNRVILVDGIDLMNITEDQHLIEYHDPLAGDHQDMMISTVGTTLQQKSSVFLRTTVDMEDRWDGWLRQNAMPPPVVTPDDPSGSMQHFLSSRTALLHQGYEFVADEILTQMAKNPTDLTQGFVAMQSGKSTYKGALRTDLRSTHVMVGAGFGNEKQRGIFFADFGMGESDDRLAGIAQTKEDLRYYGVGFAYFYNWENPWHMDVSTRIGYTKSSLEGTYQVDQKAIDVATDLSGTFVSAHVGLGYDYAITPEWTMTPYARVGYIHVAGDSSSIQENDRTNQASMDSTSEVSAFVGVTFDQKVGSVVATYGTGYEWVRYSDAILHVNGVALAQQGHTQGNATFELAVHSDATQNDPWQWHVGVKGYLGDRQGYSVQGIVERRF